MKDIDQSRTASVLSLIVGVWVAISPMFISMTAGLATTVVILGVIVAVASLVQVFWENVMPSWVSGAAAVLLFITAFIAGTVSTAALWNLLISSVAIFALAVWDEIEISHYIGERHSHQY